MKKSLNIFPLFLLTIIVLSASKKFIEVDPPNNLIISDVVFRNDSTAKAALAGIYSEMIGNKIAQRTFADRDIPLASALSALLTLAVLIPLTTITLARLRNERLKPVWRAKE